MQRTVAILVKVAVMLIGLVPFRLLYILSDTLYLIIYFILRYRRKVVLTNLRNAFPSYSSIQIEQTTRNFYRYFSDLLLESLKGFTLRKSELQMRFHYKNAEIFTPYFKKGQSIILLGSHYGNWEWGVLSFALTVRHKVVGIYKPVKNRHVEAFLNKKRTRWGLTLVSMAHAGRAIKRLNREPGIFVLIADQTPSDVKNACWINFLHQDTPFLHGADKLARQTGYPVFMFRIVRLKRGFYEVIFEEICPSPQKMTEGTVMAKFVKKLEHDILENPPFWLWSHRRWKRKRPLISH